MHHTLIALVENKPGVLNRIASLFRRRNFNIDSLNVGRSENPALSRMTLVVNSDDVSAERVEANLYKLVNVVDVQDVTGDMAILRELCMVKVAVDADRRSELLQMTESFKAEIADVSADTIVIQLTASSENVDNLIEMLRPFGILESVRTGHVAMIRGSGQGVRHIPSAAINH